MKTSLKYLIGFCSSVFLLSSFVSGFRLSSSDQKLLAYVADAVAVIAMEDPDRLQTIYETFPAIIDQQDGKSQIILQEIYNAIGRDHYGVRLSYEGRLAGEQLAVLQSTLETNNKPFIALVYADLQCPFCKTFAQDTLPVLRAEYGQELAIVYQHFPLSFHTFARPAAIMAQCIANHNDTLDMQSYIELFFAQASFDGPDTIVSDLAASGGYLSDEVRACYESATSAPSVDRHIQQGTDWFGVRGTPNTVIIHRPSGKWMRMNGALAADAASEHFAQFRADVYGNQLYSVD